MSVQKYEKTSLFDMGIEPYRPIGNKLYLISLFSGYDAQAIGIKYLFEAINKGKKRKEKMHLVHYKTCEWYVRSIQALKNLHFEKDNRDYSKDLDDESVYERLANYGISNDEKEPLSIEKMKRSYKPNEARKIYNNIIATHNLVNVMNVKGKDLMIRDNRKKSFLLTYSFPCTDISLAGDLKGLDKNDWKDGNSTRSGLLWEVERILDECLEMNPTTKQHLPSILILENVPNLIGKKNVKWMGEWVDKLSRLGYKNYFNEQSDNYGCLNGKDFGIPQSRNRMFMISILQQDEEFSYDMPKPIPLKLILQDLLEKNVPQKYYLNEAMKLYISNDNEKWSGNNDKALVNKTIASTINTREGSRRCDASNYICEQLPNNFDIKPLFMSKDKSLKETLAKNEVHYGDFIDTYNRSVSYDGLCGTITTKISADNHHWICDKLVVPLKRGYNFEGKKPSADPIDNIDYLGSYAKGGFGQSYVVGTKGIAPTITDNHNEVVAVLEPKLVGGIGNLCNKDTQYHMQNRVYNANGVALCLCTSCNPYYLISTIELLTIRKLTCRECARVMAIKDRDISKLLIGQSQSSAYHLLGNSLLPNIIMALVGNLYGFDWVSAIDNFKGYWSNEKYSKYEETIQEAN